MELKNITMKDEKEYKSWRKEVESEGLTKSVSVKECENGYYICIRKEGMKNDAYTYETKNYISTTNPLEGEKEYTEKVDVKEEVMEAVKALGI